MAQPREARFSPSCSVLIIEAVPWTRHCARHDFILNSHNAPGSRKDNFLNRTDAHCFFFFSNIRLHEPLTGKREKMALSSKHMPCYSWVLRKLRTPKSLPHKETYHIHGKKVLIIREMSVCPQLACIFNVTSFKTRTNFFKGLEKLSLNVYWSKTDKAEPHHIYRRTNQRNWALPDTETKYRCVMIRTAWC